MTEHPWHVPPLWRGETVACIASGPSLTRTQVDAVPPDWRVIAINDNYLLPPDRAELNPRVDLLYACDGAWWLGQAAQPRYRRSLAAWDRRKVTFGCNEAVGAGLVTHWLEDGGWNPAAGLVGLDDRPTHLRHGQNSGYQAIHLAVHLGAARIVLLGYDAREGPNGREHWFGRHVGPDGRDRPTAPQIIRAWAGNFDWLVEPLARRGVEVLNASPSSAIRAFPRVDLIGGCIIHK